MPGIPNILPSKQPRRPHHIQDWAAKLGLNQAQLVAQIGADKGLVSRWYTGSSPGFKWQGKLAAFFKCDREALFRHPDEDWMLRFFQGRNREEIDRIKHTLEVAFPPPEKQA